MVCVKLSRQNCLPAGLQEALVTPYSMGAAGCECMLIAVPQTVARWPSSSVPPGINSRALAVPRFSRVSRNHGGDSPRRPPRLRGHAQLYQHLVYSIHTMLCHSPRLDSSRNIRDRRPGHCCSYFFDIGIFRSELCRSRTQRRQAMALH